MENREVLDLAPGTELKQVDSFPRSIQLFERAVADWESHAENMGAATDPLQGEQSTAGTPFAAIQAQIQQGMGLHDYRRGIFAKHLEEIYKDDYIPQIEKKITEGTTFLSELSLEELQYVTEGLVKYELEKVKKEYVLSNMGQAMTPDMEQQFEQSVRDEIKKKGNKWFIEILKGEFKNIKCAVKVNVAGKSKNLGKATDTLVNLLKFAFANPQGFAMTMQIPGMASAFNAIIEYAGLDPVNFAGIEKMAISQPPQPQGQQQQQSGPPQGQPGQPQPSPQQMQPQQQLPTNQPQR